MDKRQIASRRRRVQALQRRLGALGPLMRGTVVRIGTRNKQFYFSLNKDKKTVLIYLGDKRVGRAREYSANYKRLLEIADQMTMLNIELLKEDAAL